MIRGYFDPDAGWPVPRVRVYLFLPGIMEPGDWQSVDFLLDTGASNTSLHPLDAITRVGIEPSRLASPELWSDVVHAEGVGGAAAYYTVEAWYGFIHEDSTTQLLHGRIDIAELTHTNMDLPSLLGWDVLRHFHTRTDQRTGEVGHVQSSGV